MVINQWLHKRAAATDYKKVCAAYHCVLRQVTDAERVLIPTTSLGVGGVTFIASQNNISSYFNW